MSSLLMSLSFRKITIKGICEEAFISRAAFYAHFVDKYDLLKHWMADLWPKDLDGNDSYDEFESAVNCQVQQNRMILKNLVYEADSETYAILFDFLLSTINLRIEKGGRDEMYRRNVVMSNFYAGGAISYLLWQVENRFPADMPLMNRHLYEMVHELQEWHSK